MGFVGIEECVFVPSGGALGLLLGCCLGPLLLWVVSGSFVYFFVYLEVRLCIPWVVGLGFHCILEALRVLFLVYLEAPCAYFLVYNTLTYQKKKKIRGSFFRVI
jgi:hypothetical protein